MGKAFEKQITTIEDQGEKQIKAIPDKGQIKKIKKYAHDVEDTLFISKLKEIFNRLAGQRLKKITDLDERVNRDDLIYQYKGNTDDLKFDEFDNALGVINKIQDGKMDLSDAKYNQRKI